MTKNKKKTFQNIKIAIISFLIVAILSLIIYMVFFKKDNNDNSQIGENNSNNNIVFTMLEREVLEDYNHKYITNYFTLITGIGQCEEYLKEAIDNKGNKIEFIDNYYQITELRIENGKLIATGNPDCPCDSKLQQCKPNTKVELVYNGKTIEINEFK